MTPSKTSQPGTLICFVVGQGTEPVIVDGVTSSQSIKSAPPYSGQLPQVRTIRERTTKLFGRSTTVRVKAVLPEHYVVEATTTVPNIFSDSILKTKEHLLGVAKKAMAKLPVNLDFFEEYTLYCVRDYRGDPQQFFRHAHRMVALMKSERIPLSDVEVATTMENSSLQYGKNDVTILDWDGAFIFEPHGHWFETVDLLQVANTHLLRLRVLDAQLDQHLSTMMGQIERLPKIGGGKVRKIMSDLMHLRSTAIKDFEHTERDIQLIGDWYAAKLYAMAKRKFSLDRWRAAIREELSTLQEMTTMAADYFSVTNERRAEQVQQVLWYIQLIGWFVLLFLEWRVLT